MDQGVRDQKTGAIVRLLAGVPDGQLGLVQTVVERLGGNDGEAWAKQLNSVIGQPLPILEFVFPVAVLPLPEFIACDHFKVDTTGEVKIDYIDDSFYTNFLADCRKVGENVAETTLRVHRLTKSLSESKVIAELGGEGIVETSLAQMYAFIREQGRGQRGVLRTDGYANVFFIRDTNDVLWAASYYWDAGCYRYWSIFAHLVEDSYMWSAGSQVFSH